MDDIARVFARLDREIWLVTASAGSRRGGLIATFVSDASIVPAMPRVVIGLARQHHTWELIESSRAFGLHLLGEEHLDWVWRFGLQSGRHIDKLDGLTLEHGAGGCLLLADALVWLDCRVEASLDTGDRTLYLAEVVDGRLKKLLPPLTRKRLLQIAPPERLRDLKEQLGRDANVDANAIANWRRSHRSD